MPLHTSTHLSPHGFHAVRKVPCWANPHAVPHTGVHKRVHCRTLCCTQACINICSAAHWRATEPSGAPCWACVHCRTQACTHACTAAHRRAHTRALLHTGVHLSPQEFHNMLLSAARADADEAGASNRCGVEACAQGGRGLPRRLAEGGDARQGHGLRCAREQELVHVSFVLARASMTRWWSHILSRGPLSSSDAQAPSQSHSAMHRSMCMRPCAHTHTLLRFDVHAPP